MRPKTCALVTKFGNQVQSNVRVQMSIGDLNRSPKWLAVERVVSCSSCVCQENTGACQRIEKLLPVATTRHE